PRLRDLLSEQACLSANALARSIRLQERTLRRSASRRRYASSCQPKCSEKSEDGLTDNEPLWSDLYAWHVDVQREGLDRTCIVHPPGPPADFGGSRNPPTRLAIEVSCICTFKLEDTSDNRLRPIRDWQPALGEARSEPRLFNGADLKWPIEPEPFNGL